MLTSYFSVSRYVDRNTSLRLEEKDKVSDTREMNKDLLLSAQLKSKVNKNATAMGHRARCKKVSVLYETFGSKPSRSVAMPITNSDPVHCTTPH